MRRLDPRLSRPVRLRVLPALQALSGEDGEAPAEFEASEFPPNPEILEIPAPVGLATYLERLLNEVRSH